MDERESHLIPLTMPSQHICHVSGVFLASPRQRVYHFFHDALGAVYSYRLAGLILVISPLCSYVRFSSSMFSTIAFTIAFTVHKIRLVKKQSVYVSTQTKAETVTVENQRDRTLFR